MAVLIRQDMQPESLSTPSATVWLHPHASAPRDDRAASTSRACSTEIWQTCGDPSCMAGRSVCLVGLEVPPRWFHSRTTKPSCGVQELQHSTRQMDARLATSTNAVANTVASDIHTQVDPGAVDQALTAAKAISQPWQSHAARI